MNIIDAHHHLWAPMTPSLDVGYVWLKDIGAMKPFGDPTPIQRDYLLEEYLGERPHSPVTASVHVQADPRLPDPVAETAFVQKISDDSGHQIAIVGFGDLTSKEFPQIVARHKAHPNLRGIRQILSHLPDRPELSFAPKNFLDDPLWRENFEVLAEQKLRFDLQLYPEQMLQAAEFLAEHPTIPVVVDHLGSPYDTSSQGMALWSEGMQALASLPQVHAKLSGYAMFFHDALDGPAERVTQGIVEWFGPDRTMFGSNFPVDKLHLKYESILTFLMGQTEPSTHERIFGEVARRFYGI